jgi:N-acetylneuraminic acid mutarotase
MDSPAPGRDARLKWKTLPPLPRPVSNNAVAASVSGGRTLLFSFMGIGTSKSYAGITKAAFRLDTASGTWTPIRPVPGSRGRIGATAQALGGLIYLFGGFTVDERLREKTLDQVDIYDPAADAYSSGVPIPVPVDDAVSVAWKDRLIYLVGGWSENRNVSTVQFYDPAADLWGEATPLPGPPVFGHAGGIADDTIVICDGVEIDLWQEPRFVLSARCFRGEIDLEDPTRISWSKIPPHPGRPRYRMAAGTLPGEGLVVFTGGGDRPYNYDGMGYDGDPSRPTAETFAYHVASGRWRTSDNSPRRSMDHRGLAGDGRALYLVGGMTDRQTVTDVAQMLSLNRSGGAAVP